MAGLIDFENLHLNIFKNNKCLGEEDLCKDPYYIGQPIYLQLRCKISQQTLHKLKEPKPPRSPASLNFLGNLKRQLANSTEVKCLVRGLTQGLQNLEDKQMSSHVSCQVSCSHDEVETHENCAAEPFFSKDKCFYNIPINVQIPNIPTHCKRAEISVHIRPSSKLGPSWLSSPTKPESPSCEDMETSSTLAWKIITKVVRVIHPPKVLMQQSHVGNQEMIFLQVKNSSSRPLRVLECTVLPTACPKSSAGSQHCSNQSDARDVCVFHAGMVKVLPGDDSLLPDLLRPGECVSLCYTLDLVQCESSFSKDDLMLEAKIKWNIPKSKNKTNTSETPVITKYKLHELKLRRGLFIMSAKCEESNIKREQSFTVTYTIQNKLQDFLSIKIYWSPALPDSSCESERQFEKLKKNLICHDPSVQLGSCRYGDTVQAKVSFCATSKGLYEVCKHMKINLRYLIPGSDNDSLASPTSQCSATSEDHTSLAPDSSWRGRSGSGSSASSARVLTDGRNISSTNKSSSLGDLAHKQDDDLFKHQRSEKSPVLPRRDPKLNVTSAAKYEQMLLSPGNFIKNTCLVMVE